MNSSTPTSPTAGRTTRFAQIREYYDKNEHRFAVIFFIGGFFFDVMMLERIDSFSTIAQQVVYLSILTAGLTQMFFEETRPPFTTEKMFFLKRWYYDYRSPLLHFFFGTLLNLYTLFFFKSSSLIVSFFFMLFMVFLILANESARFKSLGLAFKFALLSLCMLCFSSFMVPILIGRIGRMVFLFSMLVGCLPLVGIGWWVQTFLPSAFDKAKSQILIPLGLVSVGFLAAFFLRLIPPVPLSIPFIGIYHSVERVPEGYKLGHERPWWKFWHNGDQYFLAQTADKIHVFFRIFSPARFADQVLVRWYWHDNRQGWVLQDSIPIKIHGGREEGFRGFGVKGNYQPGSWKVQIETTDEREIGRVYFELEIAPQAQRTFEFEIM